MEIGNETSLVRSSEDPTFQLGMDTEPNTVLNITKLEPIDWSKVIPLPLVNLDNALPYRELVPFEKPSSSDHYGRTTSLEPHAHLPQQSESKCILTDAADLVCDVPSTLELQLQVHQDGLFAFRETETDGSVTFVDSQENSVSVLPKPMIVDSFQLQSVEFEDLILIGSPKNILDETHRTNSVTKIKQKRCKRNEGEKFTEDRRAKSNQPNVEQMNSKNSVIKCPTCNKTFKRNSTLKRHQITHSADPKPFTCDTCNKKFTQLTTLKIHERQIHAGSKTYTHCTFCPKKFSRKNDWVRHVKGHLKPATSSESIKSEVAKPRESNYECECGKKFRYKQDLRRHQTIHNGEKKYQCPYCHQSFRLAYNLKDHIEGHLHKTKYRSKYCELSFRHLGTLLYHEKLHEDKGICRYCPKNSFNCKDCAHNSPTRYLLEQHVLQNHG